MLEQKKVNNRALVRNLKKTDLPAILKLEAKSYINSHPQYGKWLQKDYEDAILRSRNHGGFVIERKSTQLILASCIFGVFPHKIHICNYSVVNAYQGLEEVIFKCLLDKCRNDKKKYLEMDVRETLLDLQVFLRDFGFKAYKVARSWYEDTLEDCYKFRIES